MLGCTWLVKLNDHVYSYQLLTLASVAAASMYCLYVGLSHARAHMCTKTVFFSLPVSSLVSKLTYVIYVLELGCTLLFKLNHCVYSYLSMESGVRSQKSLKWTLQEVFPGQWIQSLRNNIATGASLSSSCSFTRRQHWSYFYSLIWWDAVYSRTLLLSGDTTSHESTWKANNCLISDYIKKGL